MLPLLSSKEEQNMLTCHTSLACMLKLNTQLFPLASIQIMNQMNSANVQYNTIQYKCDLKCDLKSCSINAANESWKIFHGCCHSFHRRCLDGLSYCLICKDFLKRQIQELGNVAKNSILYPNTASEPD